MKQIRPAVECGGPVSLLSAVVWLAVEYFSPLCTLQLTRAAALLTADQTAALYDQSHTMYTSVQLTSAAALYT